MQNSMNKSLQLDYSNCKLSPIIFYPDTNQREKNDFFTLDNRNRLTFLQSSMISGKMGIIEPNLGSQYYAKLKDLATINIEDSKINSKKSQIAQRGEENSVKKSFPSFDHPWSMKNISFNSNQNFKMTQNLGRMNNSNSAFKNLQTDSRLNATNKRPTSDNRNPRELNHFTSFQKQFETSAVNNHCRPQVYSTILKNRNVETIISNNVPVSNYNNLNNNNFPNKLKRNETFGNNNLNVTIINNNNFNLNNVVSHIEKKRRVGRSRKQSHPAEKSCDETENNYQEFNPETRKKKYQKQDDKKEEKSKRRANWKKVIEICREADEYSKNTYNNKLLNRKKNRSSQTPFDSNNSKYSQETPHKRLDRMACLNDEKISTNIITKRILEDKLRKKPDRTSHSLEELDNNIENSDPEGNRLFKSENKRKLKRFKKSENINIKLENTEKNLQVNHKYLFEPFKENPDIYSSCNFINDEMKKEYTYYLTYGKSNEHNLTFGDNPLTIYQNLAEWFNREIRKNEQNTKNFNSRETLELCEKIIFEMNDISKCISTLPIFMYPATNKPKIGNKINKYKKRKKFEEEGPVYTCDVCLQKFNTGQGLGGHMSRKHPKASEKFNKKKEIRKNREEHRNILYEAKKKLLTNFNFDYDELRKTTEGKKKIKEIVKKNKEIFKLIRINIAKSRKKDKQKSSEKGKAVL